MADVIKINRPFTTEEVKSQSNIIKINRPFTKDETPKISPDTGAVALKSIADIVPGTRYATSFYENLLKGKGVGGALKQATQETQEQEQIQPRGVGQKVLSGAITGVGRLPFYMGATGALRAIPMLATHPIISGMLGMGTVGAGEQITQGQPEQAGKAFVSGAAQYPLMHATGVVGGLGKTPLARRVLTGAGFGATGTGQTALSGGKLEDVISSGIVGAGMGAMLPSSPKIISKSPAKLTKEATEAYRNILRPNQSEIKNIEIRQGKNIDDYYRLAAEEQLPIKQTLDKKLDTTLARQKLQPKIDEIHNQLNSILETRQNKFNLKTLAVKVKLELAKTIKNAKELKDAQVDVDNYINSEIERYGNEKVLPLEFNNIKQGMWSVAYDMLKPTSKSTARKIGFVAKEMIENAYPNKDIKGLNELSGKYQALTNLLENAQGRTIQGGKLGKYFAQTIGAIAGATLPLPGMGRVAGILGGKWIGGKIQEHLASPERISKIASKKMQSARIIK